jgi:hypothetical protein
MKREKKGEDCKDFIKENSNSWRNRKIGKAKKKYRERNR